MSEILKQADAIRALAEGKFKRGSDIKLYRVLVECMALCERCRDASDIEEIRTAFAMRGVAEGQNRTYIEKQSDVYQVVCRYVFHGGPSHANMCRYAIALRQAASRQITSETLMEQLVKNGGVNALFLRRAVDKPDIETKCLRLTSRVRAPKHGAFCVWLKYNHEGAFDVVEAAQ